MGGAPAPASGEPPKGAPPAAAGAPAAAPKSLLADAEKPADGTPATDPAKPAESPAAKPEEWTLAAPKDVAVDAKDLSAIETFAKANGLSKVQAEKLLARDLEARTASVSAQKTIVDQAANTFADQVEKDPDLGGAKLPETIAAAKRALVAAFTAEERKTILASPLGNHRLFIKALVAAAAGLPKEDAAALSGAGSAPSGPLTLEDAARVMYPKTR